MKGILDLKTGKSAAGWSLIERGARFEGRTVRAETSCKEMVNMLSAF
jgi:hypothetical protein